MSDKSWLHRKKGKEQLRSEFMRPNNKPSRGQRKWSKRLKSSYIRQKRECKQLREGHMIYSREHMIQSREA